MTSRPALIARSALSLALMATPIFVHAQATPPGQAHAAVPLGRALSGWAGQHGVALAFDPGLTAGRQAPALAAGTTLEEGFARLLDGTGLQAVRRHDGSYALEPAATVPAPRGRMPALKVGGLTQPAFRYSEGLALEADYLQAQVAGNGDIGSMLRINPAVQFDNAQLSSYTPGDISPAEISINGAQFYQNSFLVDGMSFNNDIDPGQEGSPYRLFAAPGGSQALALDTDLLDTLTVLDSNVPAAYGGFSGGVVDARLRRPSDALSGSISHQITRSAWTRYHIAEADAENYANASSWGDGQPEFDKAITRITLEGHPSERVGLLANFTRKRSTIPTYFYSSHLVDDYGREKAMQRRETTQSLLKGVWDVNERLTVDATLTHTPTENQFFRSNIRHAGIRIETGGTLASLRAAWTTDWGTVTQQLGWSDTEQSRDAEQDDYMTWSRSTSKDWGTTALTLEGEFGDIEQRQKRLQYKLDLKTDALQAFGGEHRLGAGVLLERDDFRYARLTESSTYTTPARTSTCTNRAGVTDALTCAMGTTASGWPGQYLTRRTRYTTGEIGFDTETYGMYVEDDMRFGPVSVRPGLRIERDTYIGRTTVAPRLAASWAVRDGTLLTAGANRYYDRDIATWRLRDGVNRLRYNSERRTSLDSDWTVGTQASNDTHFDLDRVGYADELMLALRQDWAGLRVNLKAVNRRYRDQVIKVQGRTLDQQVDDPTLATSYDTWTNGGRAETNIYSLTVQPLRNLAWGGTRSTALLALDWTDQRSTLPEYDDQSDLFYQNPWIRYDGDFIRYRDLPPDNYNRPWTARLSTITRIDRWNLTVSNLLRYRAGYRAIRDTGRNVLFDGEAARVWEQQSYSPALTWDLRLAWEQPLPSSAGRIFANVDVTNLLDKANAYGESSSATRTVLYETGRQFWLELGYRF